MAIITKDITEQLIKDVINKAVSKRYQEALEDAKKQIEAGIQEDLAKITLSIFKHYEVYTDRGKLIIQINNNKGVMSMKAYVTIEFTNGWKKRSKIFMPNLSEAMKYINCHRLALKQFGYSDDVMTSYIEHI